MKPVHPNTNQLNSRLTPGRDVHFNMRKTQEHRTVDTVANLVKTLISCSSPDVEDNYSPEGKYSKDSKIDHSGITHELVLLMKKCDILFGERVQDCAHRKQIHHEVMLLMKKVDIIMNERQNDRQYISEIHKKVLDISHPTDSNLDTKHSNPKIDSKSDDSLTKKFDILLSERHTDNESIKQINKTIDELKAEKNKIQKLESMLQESIENNKKISEDYFKDNNTIDVKSEMDELKKKYEEKITSMDTKYKQEIKGMKKEIRDMKVAFEKLNKTLYDSKNNE